MNYRIVDAAIADIQAAADYYDAREPTLGDEFADVVQLFVQELCRIPQKFARVNRYPKKREIREGMTRRFPYVVVYEVTPLEIVVLSVTHSAKIHRPWRERLGS